MITRPRAGRPQVRPHQRPRGPVAEAVPARQARSASASLRQPATDLRHLGLAADAFGQLPERGRFVGSVHDPPQAMPALRAARQRVAVAQRAGEAAPRREHLRTLEGRVIVGQQERRHELQTDAHRPRRTSGNPLLLPP